MLEETLAKLLSRVTEFSVATGDATDGSTTELEDTNAVWEVNKWKDAVVEITQSFQVLTLAPAPAGYTNCVITDIGKMVQDDGEDAGLLLAYDNTLRVWQIRTTTTIVGGSVMTIPTGTGAGIAAISVTSSTHYFVTITSNTANTLTFDAIAVAVVAGDHYEIRMTLRLADIDKWGGTAQTGRDISLDLKSLTDDSIKGLLKSIGDIAALENLITRFGQTTDAVVAAGAAGSMSAKLRRVTQGLEDLKTLIALSQLPAALTAAGNLKQSIEEHLAAAVALHTSGAETTSGNGADTDVSKYLYAETCIDVTAFADMASADLIVEGKDETSGKYKTIHTHNFTGTGTDWLSITMLAFQHVRARWVINTPGGSPSVTFLVALQGKS